MRIQQTRNDVEAPGPSNPPGQQSPHVASKKTTFQWIVASTITVISLSLMAAFIYAALYKGNDWPFPDNNLQWLIFEILNAVVPATFLLYYWFSFPPNLFHVLSTAANIWSIVYVVLMYTASDDVTRMYRDTIELVVYLGMFSSFFHTIIARFFVKKGNSRN